MPCYHPQSGWRDSDGKFTKKETSHGRLEIACGGCIGCRIDRSRDWAIRCHHEAQMHEENCFMTLTYDPRHLPKDYSVNLQHFQIFIRRLRKHTKRPIRFFHCGEYGDQTQRPHYHALLFGYDFPDKEIVGKSPNGKYYRYTSDKANRIWTRGAVELGSVTMESAGYVARYVMKKVNGDKAKEHYTRINPETGEICEVRPEYATMSRRPGLGYSWYQRYKNDLYPHDFVIVDGRKYPVPKYYDRLLEKESPILMSEIRALREETYYEINDNTDERLAVKKEVKTHQLNHLSRGL